MGGSSGFNATLSGIYSSSSSFFGSGTTGYYYTSTRFTSGFNNAKIRGVTSTRDNIIRTLDSFAFLGLNSKLKECGKIIEMIFCS